MAGVQQRMGGENGPGATRFRQCVRVGKERDARDEEPCIR